MFIVGEVAESALLLTEILTEMGESTLVSSSLSNVESPLFKSITTIVIFFEAMRVEKSIFELYRVEFSITVFIIVELYKYELIIVEFLISELLKVESLIKELLTVKLLIILLLMIELSMSKLLTLLCAQITVTKNDARMKNTIDNDVIRVI